MRWSSRRSGHVLDEANGLSWKENDSMPRGGRSRRGKFSRNGDMEARESLGRENLGGLDSKRNSCVASVNGEAGAL